MDGTEITLTKVSLRFLKDTSKWSMILALLGFVIIAVMLILSYLLPTTLSYSIIPGGHRAMHYNGITYLAIAVISLYPVIALFRFSKECKAAITSNDANLIDSSFSKLKSYFKSIVLIIIFITIFAVLFFVFSFYTYF